MQIVAPKQTPELAPSISSAHFILSCCNFQTFRRFETQQQKHPCLPCQLPCNCGLYVDGVIWSPVKYNSWSLSFSLYTCHLVYTQYYLRVQWHTKCWGWESRNFQNLWTGARIHIKVKCLLLLETFRPHRNILMMSHQSTLPRHETNKQMWKETQAVWKIFLRDSGTRKCMNMSSRFLNQTSKSPNWWNADATLPLGVGAADVFFSVRGGGWKPDHSGIVCDSWSNNTDIFRNLAFNHQKASAVQVFTPNAKER